MPFVANPVDIPDPIQPVLTNIANSRSLPASQVQRAKIILLAADGLSNAQISKEVHLGRNPVSKWRNRYIDALPMLREVAEKSPTRLKDEVAALLGDLPRSGQPPTYTDEQIMKIIEVACRKPEELGYEASHWSLNMLVDAVVKEGIVDSISAKTVSRFLKYGENPPTSRPLLAAFFRKNRFPGNLCRESE